MPCGRVFNTPPWLQGRDRGVLVSVLHDLATCDSPADDVF